MPTVVTGVFHFEGRQWCKGEVLPQDKLQTIPAYNQSLLFANRSLAFMDDESAASLRAKNEEQSAEVAEKARLQRIERTKAKIAEFEEKKADNQIKAKQADESIGRLNNRLIELGYVEPVDMEPTESPEPIESPKDLAPKEPKDIKPREEKSKKTKGRGFGRSRSSGE